MVGAQTPEAVAARLISWLRERDRNDANAAISIDALLDDLGLAVATFDPRLIPDTLGYLEPGEDVIFVRAGLAEQVRRFTLAHELGHVILHRRAGRAAEIGGTLGGATDDAIGDGCGDLDLELLAGDDETLRPGQAYSARAQREGEANAFAAALLLPSDTTRAVYESLCARGVERPALALARSLGVSEDAALRRLAALLTAPEDERGAEAPVSAAPASLDEDQRRAAQTQAPALIVAGPGSGKTSALLARIGYLRDTLGVAPERILALTFSRKAAEELQNRATAAQASEAVGVGPHVSTIHAFCGDLLRQYGPLVGLRSDYRLMTGVEGYFLLRRLVNRAPLTHYTPLSGPTRHFGSLLSAISRAKDDLVTPEAYQTAAEAMLERAESAENRMTAERALEVASVYAAYQAELSARGDVDYGDLIMKVVELLRSEPAVTEELRQRYPHILVDEFQDINIAMGTLLREFAGRNGAIWAVGDVDQAIYRFRGGSPSNMLNFTHDYDHARVITLAKNYRSRPPILRAADAFASANLPAEARIASQPMRSEASGGETVVTLALAPNADAELDGLARLMRERVAAGIPLREQAVLLRTRDNVKQVCAGLRLRGIPAQFAVPLFEQPLIKTLLATVSLTAEPMASGLLRAGEIPDHPFSDEAVRDLLQFARERHISPFEAIRMDEVERVLPSESLVGLRRLDRIIAELRVAPSVAVGMSRYVFSSTSLGRRLLADPGQADAAVVGRLLEICRAYDDLRAAALVAESDQQGTPVADWAGLLDYAQAVRVLNADSGSVTVTEGDDAVLVMTAHAAKGLEFTAVYLPQLIKGRFPKPPKKSEAPAPPGLLRDDEDDEQEHLRDEANLFYVSLTRTRETLTLSYGPSMRNAPPSPSPFLEPIEVALGAELARVHWEASAVASVDAMSDEQPEAEPTPTTEPRIVSINEIDVYTRCPQQYAYQYVYGLRPMLAAPISLSEAYKMASAEVSRRFAAGDPPTLESSLALFEERWLQCRTDALRMSDKEAGAEGDETLAAIYQAHGRRAIERLWRALSHDGAGDPEAAGLSAMGAGATTPATVTFAGVNITGSLDHVAAGPERKAQVARYKHGKLEGQLGVRDFFYSLAAEEMAQGGQAAQALRVSLASGEVKPLSIGRQRQRLEQEVSAALAGLARKDYTPLPKPQTCSSCPFALICPA